MLQATYTQGNWGDFWLLMVGSQIVNLTLGPSFGHDLCFGCPNGSYEPTLDIYVPRVFQWYKDCLNSMGFDPWNLSPNIRDSNSQSGSSLGSVKVHSLTLSCTPRSMRCDSQDSLLARPLASLCLGREPKAKVVTQNHFQFLFHCSYGILCLHYNNLLILHGKPKSYQFFLQLLLFNLCITYFAHAHFSNSHNKTWKFATHLIFMVKCHMEIVPIPSRSSHFSSLMWV